MINPTDISPSLSVGQRFRGAIIGAAIGNALGVSTEMQPARPRQDWVTSLAGGGWRQWPAGAWAEETDLMLLVASSLLERKVFDPEDIAVRLAQWANDGPVNLNPNVLQVLKLIHSGTPWMNAASEVWDHINDERGNDALPLCIPLALYFFNTPSYITTLAPVLSSITLQSDACNEAASIFTLILAYVIAGHNLEGSVNHALNALETRGPVAQAVESTSLPEVPEPPKATALATLRTAVWAFRWHGSFEDAIAAAANMGEDAGCAATLAGTLAGALYGEQSIPPAMLEAIKERNRLYAIADSLCGLAGA